MGKMTGYRILESSDLTLERQKMQNSCICKKEEETKMDLTWNERKKQCEITKHRNWY